MDICIVLQDSFYKRNKNGNGQSYRRSGAEFCKYIIFFWSNSLISTPISLQDVNSNWYIVDQADKMTNTTLSMQSLLLGEPLRREEREILMGEGTKEGEGAKRGEEAKEGEACGVADEDDSTSGTKKKRYL